MEALQVLEQKIARLIESKKEDLKIIAELKKEIEELQVQRQQLYQKVDDLENSLLCHDQVREQQKIAAQAVDELIQSIDAFTGEEVGV